MKELSIEEKAKRYDEAIERAKAYQGLRSEMEIIFPELKESEDERIRKGIIRNLEYLMDRAEGFVKDELKERIAWLEKKGEKGINGNEREIPNYEHKPADKIEPKFKAGDWVIWDNKISCHIENIYQSKNSLMYTITDTNNMTRSYSVKGFDSNAHLWTIQDAKDGDVLVFKNNIGGIIICKSPTNDDTRSYCRLVSDNLINKEESGWDSTLLVPATQEQRDALMKAMAEAGYEWDSENRELKKIDHKELTDFQEIFRSILIESNGKYDDNTVIRLSGQVLELVEQKPVEWSEEDEKIFDRICFFIHSSAYENYEVDEDGNECGKYANIKGWFKKLKDKVQPQPKQEWSEDDESRMDNLCHFLEEYGNQYYGQLTLQCTISWLKSLRSKKQWKPSDEQMEALDSATENCAYSEYQDCLRELIGQLKKLREE